MSTHIAAIVTALHGKPVQIIQPPSDGQLFDRIFMAYAQVRWPEQDEDTDAIMNAARMAARELYGRIGDMRNELYEVRSELKRAHALRQAAVDA